MFQETSSEDGASDRSFLSPLSEYTVGNVRGKEMKWYDTRSIKQSEDPEMLIKYFYMCN